MSTEKESLTDAAGGPYVGQALPRREDLALLTGAAQFVDDLRLPGMVYAGILRSPHAHARITRLDTGTVAEMPGVHDVLVGADLVGKVEPWGDLTKDVLVGDRFPFATDKVIYEGQEVAAVVAETRWQAQDAVDAIHVEYQTLPAVIDPEAAMEPGAPLVQDTIAYEFGTGNTFDAEYRIRIGDYDRVREQAAVVVRERFTTGRTHAAALEPHGCVADYDVPSGRLTLYSSTQMVHILRDALSRALHLPRTKVRVVALNVGGSFGSKGELFPWEVIAAVLAMRLGRPVNYTLTRPEVFRVGTSRTNQVRYSEMALDGSGAILGYSERIVVNGGAVSAWGNQIMRIGTQIGMLPYPIANIKTNGFAVHTHTGPAGPVRGFGVPQAVFAKESLLDMAAEELGLDPVEIRVRNCVAGVDCPTTTPLGQYVDSTTVDDCVRAAASAIGWPECQSRLKAGEGVGFAVCMKYTSARHPSLDSDLSAVRVVLETDGTVSVFSGDTPHGQGHATILAQIVADALGVGIDKIRVSSADTDTTPFSLGTWGSRGAAILGTAARLAAAAAREKLLTLAAHVVDARPEDLEITQDRVHLRNRPDTGLLVENLTLLAAYATHQLPAGFEPGAIEGRATYDTPTERERSDGGGNLSPTYSCAAHAAWVQVDAETGRWTLRDYVMAHDCGVVINPLIVDGQHKGGFLHGFAMVFGEECRWESDGRMANPSFGDYPAPSAADVPHLRSALELPAASTVIPGGQKGAGESATPPVPAAVANALRSATGIRFTCLPITPDRVLLAMGEMRRQGRTSFTYPRDMPSYEGPTDWPELEDDDELEFLDDLE